MKLDVNLDDVRALRRSLSEVRRELPEEMTAIHRDIAEPVAEAAKARAPKRTGRLRDSIKPQFTKTTARVRMGGAKVPYAGPVHYGWPARNIEANPFLVAAYEDRKPQILREYADRIEALLDKEFHA